MDLFFDLPKCVHLCTVLQFKDVVLIVVSMVATVCKLSFIVNKEDRLFGLLMSLANLMLASYLSMSLIHSRLYKCM